MKVLKFIGWVLFYLVFGAFYLLYVVVKNTK